MTDQSTLRQRKKNSNKKKKAAEKKEDVAPPPTTTNEDSKTNETLSETFFKHPLIRVAPFVLIPYIVWNAIYYVELQRPDIISKGSLGLINLRPALEPQDERQVLIIGAEMAENRYVTEGMAKALNLEIVHEAFDAQKYFCRDGSVSWFQIMRFLEPLNDVSGKGREFDDQHQVAQLDTWKELCVDRNSSLVTGFHPNQYASSSTCSSREKWSGCWAKECLENINSLWGCNWKEGDNACQQQFSKVLHQVRHPIRTIELLNNTLCSNEKLKPSFMLLVKGWFLNRDWDSISCLEAMAWYEIDFQNTLIKARDAGLVHGVFQIENTSPCEVATQAGFLDEFSALYGPNAAKTSKLCHDESLNSPPQLRDTFMKVKKKNAVKIPGYEKLTLEDFEGGKHGSQLKAGDMTLVEELKKLVSNLGYDREEDSEFL